MSFPTQSKIEEALLCLLFFNESLGSITKSSQTYKPLADFFELTEQERKIPRPFKDERYEAKWNNLIQFARRGLKNKGFLAFGKPRGVWELSDKGREYAKFLQRNYLNLKPFKLEPDQPADKNQDIYTIPDLEDIDLTLSNDISSSVKEGKKRLVSHFRRERKASIVKSKKDYVLKIKGKLECEVCGFDFAEHYGKVGYGFCEAHHVRPLAESEDGIETKIEDLAIVCSNCHRMIHRTETILSIAEFKKRFQNNSL